MANKQQTAVEWLKSQYRKYGAITPTDFEQAKEMEKEQIERAFYLSKALEDRWENEEQYYNETYKQ